MLGGIAVVVVMVSDFATAACCRHHDQAAMPIRRGTSTKQLSSASQLEADMPTCVTLWVDARFETNTSENKGVEKLVFHLILANMVNTSLKLDQYFCFVSQSKNGWRITHSQL